MNNTEKIKDELVVQNNILIKNELIDAYKIYINFKNNKDSSPILMLGWMNYLTLLNLGIIDYLEKNYDADFRKNLKFKKIIKSIRARTKKDELDFNSRYEKIKQLNENSYDDFLKMSKITSRYSPFAFLIDNLGVYYFNNKIIGNTFLYNELYKPLISKQNKEEYLFNYGKEQGEIFSILSKIYAIDANEKFDTLNFKIDSTDFNVLKQTSEIFNEKIDRNICLRFLDVICKINYFFNVIAIILNTNSSLRYRIAYIIWETVYNDLSKMMSTSLFKDENLTNILNEQLVFQNKNFRNCMFHYDIKDSLKKNSYCKDEIFCGLIQQEYNISEEKYKRMLDKFLLDIAFYLENLVIK